MRIPENCPVFEKMPDGWAVLRDAATAPRGYVWIWNRKSRFGGKYEHGLLKEEAL